ncbi:sensor histidine kinase [Granulicella tundricola]|uniref:histidine kinase n=1 Tax=Granulicella tundricola (strain ATCC BAA-1859 / DSM 23138 / MP5ACTX9) TaxID=1198114 RepID=E8X5I2_GRATM|nr:HAMP domain-containing sensor histidine kinase [Granulicella tundricola]ADW69529.1 histidine kinase [Granulicella tundricola MP5ACTX9]
MEESITERNDRWAELEEALRQSRTLAAAGQFAAAVMHEINNPLEAITNLAYLAREEADDPEKVREYVSLLQEQLASVVQIAHQTLSFHRGAAALAAVDMGEITDAAVRVYQWKLAAKQIRLLKEIVPDAKVRAHAGELLQVMSNLVVNAIDALPEKGTLRLRVRRCEAQVHLTIADDGHGIPEPMLAKVFDPFFTTKADRGTGLGLAISKAIVERHQGTIRSRSSTRKGRSGTAFRISLPREIEAAERESAGSRVTG